MLPPADLLGDSFEPTAARLQVLEGRLGLKPLVLVDRVADQPRRRIRAQIHPVPVRRIDEEGEKAVVARGLRLGPELDELLAARLGGHVPVGDHGEEEGGALDLLLQAIAPVVAPVEGVLVENEFDGDALVVAGLLHSPSERGQHAVVVGVVGVDVAEEDGGPGQDGGRSRVNFGMIFLFGE